MVSEISVEDSGEKTVVALEANVLQEILSASKNSSRDYFFKYMHNQLQCTKTSLQIPLRNPAITPAVHHLSEKDHTLGVAGLCPGSSDNTTTSRKCGCTHWCRQEHQKWKEKYGAWVREGDSSFLLRDEVLQVLFRHKEMELCQKPCRCVEWVTCRFSLYCHSGISKKKPKN